MKKTGILNSEISRVLSYMGHTDRISVADCGLPIPDEVERIDLALKFGVPTFMETLKTITEDMKIEKIVLAEEIKEMNPALLDEITALFQLGGADAPEVEFIPHTEFKLASWDCKAIVRTGENTPYANIILQSACLF